MLPSAEWLPGNARVSSSYEIQDRRDKLRASPAIGILDLMMRGRSDVSVRYPPNIQVGQLFSPSVGDLITRRRSVFVLHLLGYVGREEN